MVNDLLYKEIIERMNEYQSQLEYDTTGTEVLLLALMSIEDSMTNLILKELNVTTDNVLTIIKQSYYLRDNMNYSYTLKKVLDNAYELQIEKDFVYDEAYLYSILECRNCVALNILQNLKIDGNQISEELMNALSYLEEDNKLLINLTQKAKNKELNKLIGRQNIIDKIDSVLSKKQKNNCMLIGPAGVGKSGIVEGLAYFYLKNNHNYTVYQLDIGSLLSGTKYRGDLEEKVIDLIESIKGNNNIIFIDEIHTIMNNNTSESNVDIANLLKPYLARSTIKCIGATTIDEYYKTIGKDKALARRFKNIIVNEPSDKETINILTGLKKDYENYYKLSYDNNIVKKIVYSSKYFHNLCNPDKSIDMMDECGITAKKNNDKKITINTLKKVVYSGLGINIKKSYYCLKQAKLDEKIKKDLHQFLNLNSKKYILDINIYSNNEKLKLIKELSKILNLNSENILYLDCNDYTNEHTLSTLLGTSPGYVGYENGGIVSKHVLRNNVNIIVFNNYSCDSLINKKLISKVINDGYIYDYQGNKIKFINTIFIKQKQKEKRIGYF